MKVCLKHRHFGVHEFVREIEISGKFEDYLVREDEDKSRRVLDEQKILDALPKGFLPQGPEKILLTVFEGSWGTAISVPSLFRSWAKYFDSYVLTLIAKEKAEE